MKSAADTGCPCGSGKRYADCCAPLHEGGIAATAEGLMRSRYSAYVLRRHPYVLATWHPSTRPAGIEATAEDKATKWLGLSVKASRSNGDHGALVEFVARYKVGGGSATRLHEISRFVCEDGRWYYLDGEIS